MRIITLDRGNSSLKGVVWENGKSLEHVRFPNTDLEQLWPWLDDNEFEGIAFCGVTQTDTTLTGRLRERAGSRFMQLTPATPLPFEAEYPDSSLPGADRIAAVAGASLLRPGSPSLVADLGTAMTLDVCDEKGDFRGGNISPGMGLRFSSLHEATGLLPLVDRAGAVPEFGYDTPTAIRAGVVGGMAAEIARAFIVGAGKYGCDGIVFAGSDSLYVLPLVQEILGDGVEIIVDDDLVGRGLYRIFLSTQI